MNRTWYSWWADSLGFDDSKYADDWGYKLKATRCPEAGLLEPCPDSLTRKVCARCSARRVLVALV